LDQRRWWGVRHDEAARARALRAAWLDFTIRPWYILGHRFRSFVAPSTSASNTRPRGSSPSGPAGVFSVVTDALCRPRRFSVNSRPGGSASAFASFITVE